VSAMRRAAAIEPVVALDRMRRRRGRKDKLAPEISSACVWEETPIGLRQRALESSMRNRQGRD
jgi:hypothetical protein